METLITFIKPETLPQWVLIIGLGVYGSRKYLLPFVFRKFPSMANSHLKAYSQHKTAQHKYANDERAQLLQEQLATSEAARIAASNREIQTSSILDQHAKLLDRVITILEQSLMQRLNQSDETITAELSVQREAIVLEIKGLREAIERLARKIGGSKTQDFLLERIEGKGD